MTKSTKPKIEARRLLKDYELAELKGWSVDSLRRDRVKEQKIPFINLFGIWYDVARVDEAIAERTFPKRAAK